MKEAAILEGVVAEVMVVTKTVGMTDKWELLQRSLVEATGRQVISIVTLSLGGQKRRHQMLSSQVIF